MMKKNELEEAVSDESRRSPIPEPAYRGPSGAHPDDNPHSRLGDRAVFGGAVYVRFWKNNEVYVSYDNVALHRFRRVGYGTYVKVGLDLMDKFVETDEEE